MHRKRIAVIALLVMIISSSFSFAGTNITMSAEFYSKDRDFSSSYTAREEIKVEGNNYRLKNIKYEEIKKPSETEKTVELKKLHKEKAPETKVFEVDGRKVRLYLDKSKTKYTRNPSEETYVYQRQDPYSFKPDQEKSFTIDGRPLTGTLKETSKGGIYKQPVTFPGKFTGDEGSRYFYFANTGSLWPLNTAAPTWQGYEKDILTYLGLNPSTYGITGGRWTGENSSSGNLIKTATFSGTKNVCDYTCVYTVQGGDDTYTANAVYSGYKVKAIMTYEPYMSLKTKIMIGAAIGIAAIAIAAILYFLKRKKKDEKE